MTWARLARATLLAAFAVCGASSAAVAAAELKTGPVSGLPLPRFVSLKASKVNVHIGPAKNYDVRWVYTRAGLPVEITAEFETWRRVRDWEGGEGWIYHSLLSGKRTVIVLAPPKAATLVSTKVAAELVPVFSSIDGRGGELARLQPGVQATVKSCDGTWCRIAGDSFDGWVKQERLWGVYPNEKID